nr:aspartate-alanine antiporter [uncultured Rhodopila sp.]
MIDISYLLHSVPYIALFASMAAGYWIGKFSWKNISLGAVAGTLLAAVIIGQFDFAIPGPFKSIMFALFIYAIGYQAGPAFFHSFNKSAWREVVLATFLAGAALATVLACAYFGKLNLGLAAGLASGALTQSAVIGTAQGAIAALPLPAEIKATLDSDVAIAYAVTYLFGTFGAIMLVAYGTPLIARQSLKAGSQLVEAQLSGGNSNLKPGEFFELAPYVARAIAVEAGAGKSVSALERIIGDVAITRVVRNEHATDVAGDTVLAEGDQVLVLGNRQDVVEKATTAIGHEIPTLSGISAVGDALDVVVTNKALKGKKLSELPSVLGAKALHGIHILSLTRSGQRAPLLPNTQIVIGDTLRLVGISSDVYAVSRKIGYPEVDADKTDYVWLALGIAVGILIGLITIPLGPISLSLGTGGGCVFSGLIFGWLRSRDPVFGQLPSATAGFLKSFGLCAFIGVVGLEAGPRAIATLAHSGPAILLFGVIVTVVPIIATQIFGAYVLRGQFTNSALLAGGLAGSRSCTASLGAVIPISGSNAAMLTYPVTYTLAQIYLTLFGPLIVAIMHGWGGFAILMK